MSRTSYCEKWWANHWHYISCGDYRPPMVMWFQKGRNKGLQHLVNLNVVCVDALEHTFVTRSGHEFALLSDFFILFVRPDPKKNHSLFDTWDTVVQHFYQFLGMLTLIVGIWWVAVKTEDDVCSLECKQEVLQLRAVQCAQASVRLANSGHHSHYYFTLLLNFLTETIHGSHSKWLHMHNIKWEWYIISRFLAHGRIVSDI